MIQYSKSWNSRKIVELNPRLHASQAGGDDHFTPWGDLLTNLECDPPIIVQFPFYLLMCQSFTLEPIHLREDYVYTALTGVDWVSRTDAYLHTALTSNRLGVKASLANALKTLKRWLENRFPRSKTASRATTVRSGVLRSATSEP